MEACSFWCGISLAAIAIGAAIAVVLTLLILSVLGNILGLKMLFSQWQLKLVEKVREYEAKDDADEDEGTKVDKDMRQFVYIITTIFLIAAAVIVTVILFGG